MAGPKRRKSRSAGRARDAAVGLPEAPVAAEDKLRREGIDPDRLAILRFGLPPDLLKRPFPPFVQRALLGLALWLALYLLPLTGMRWPHWFEAGAALVTGLILLQAACEMLISATERLAARLQWDHYVAGTVAEVLSTIPELVVIAFVVPVSPMAALVLALITIYNNALVFSLYSYFLPKDTRGKFLMPAPITEAGTQILTAGAAVGLIIGLVVLSFSGGTHPKTGFEPADLVLVGAILLFIFGVYVYKLATSYAREEETVRETLGLTAGQIEQRRELVYANVGRITVPVIAALFVSGIVGAFLGGQSVGTFAGAAIKDIGFNDILTALVLAVFAGMSEYVILWKAHRKREYGIALANAFGGITQVMFLVLPFTLLVIAFYQGFVNPAHPELPIQFTRSYIFLFIFLFPVFFVLIELIEEDHTLGLLDTAIMTSIFLLLIILLVAYGTDGPIVDRAVQ